MNNYNATSNLPNGFCSDFETLEDFLELIEEYKLNLSKKIQSHTPLVFRGQASSQWTLQTTLERYTNQTEFEADKYLAVLAKIAPATASFTNNNWHIEPDKIDYSEFTNKNKKFYPSHLDFMVYARHHSFPSPLLDWTESLYIALFFAFNPINEHQVNDDERIAVFSYVDSLDSGKIGVVGAAEINQIGKYIYTHKRHFLQQARYTYAFKHNNSHWTYCRHEEALEKSSSETQQLLRKWTLPAKLKTQVMRKLESMNINSYTIYGSEEALMETLANSELLPILKN